jgi:NADPH:quinone reductase-like Zn-dependent oxidoreductase
MTGARPVKAGETLVTLGTGGVSLFALQFARMFGAQVIATTSSDEKPAPCGISAPNYRVNPEWHSAVRESAGEVGGPGTLEQSIKTAAAEAAISLVGWLARTASGFASRVLSAGVYPLPRIAQAGIVGKRRPCGTCASR